MTLFTTINDKYFWLDGGSMFGIIPRVMWEKYHPADERHRILIATRVLVVRHKNRVILCDMGIGDKLSERDIEFYRVETEKGNLYSNLKAIGIEREEVTDIFLTHLHFDHAGCSTIKPKEGEVIPAFPNARYHIQKKQFEWALNPCERDRDSFNPEDFLPLQKAGVLNLLEGDAELFDGVSVMEIEGHTPGHQIIRFDIAERPVVYVGDLFPFASLIRLPWIMAYDLNPVKTLEEKKRILTLAECENWVIVYEHDPYHTATSVVKNPKKEDFRAGEEVALETLSAR